MDRILFEHVKSSVIAELELASFKISQLSYDDFQSSIPEFNQEEHPKGVAMYKMFYIDENSLNQTLKTLF